MKKIATFIFCITLTIVTGCAKAPQPKPPIKIAFFTYAGYAHAFIAQEKGYFEKNGVQVELVFDKNYAPSKQRYVEGTVDGAFEVYADAILQNSDGISARVVYILDYSVSADAIIGKPEFKDLSGLKGKKIGIDGVNTFSHLFVLAALEKSGVKEQEVFFVNVSALDVPSALEKGIIDAGYTWDPIKTALVKNGYKILAEAQYVPGLLTDVLVFNASMIKKRPQEIKAIVKALFEAREFVDSNRKEAIKIMSRPMGMTEAETEYGLQGIKRLDLKENIKAMQKSTDTTSLFGSGKIIADFYLKRGQLSRLPDLDKIIEPRFVEELGK
ncbi:MAG: ABC transporter substrate-binding protein [Candidatus Omnitrophota bacterium]